MRNIFLKTDILQLTKGSRLFKRFLILFIILAIVPVLVLGGVSLSLIDLAHRNDVSALQQQLIDQKIQEIEKFFIDSTGLLQLSTRTESLNEYPIQIGFLRGLLDTSNSLLDVSFVGLNGFRTAHMERDINGNARELSAVGNFIDNPGFQTAIDDNMFIGEINYGNEEVFVEVWAPVRKIDPDQNEVILNDPFAVIRAEISLVEIQQTIKSAKLGNLGYLVLTDGKGNIISEGSPAKLEVGTDVSHLNRVQKILSGTAYTGLAEEDRYNSFFSDVEVVSAGKKVDETGWAIMAEWPVSDADAIITDITTKIIQFVLFSIFAVLLLAPLFAARLTRPIRKLEKGAREVQEGNLKTKVNINTNDELEELGAVFNEMVEGLKRLQELKDEFVFVAAHELRTPVTAIKGYISLILEGSGGEVSDKTRRFLEQTQKSNDRLNNLVNDLLEIARSEAGRLEIKVDSVDIEKPVAETIEEIKPLADEKNITLQYTPLEAIPKVMADAGRVKEVLVNLIGNSIKYTQSGGEIKIYHKIKDGMLLTSVEDNGFGMSKEAQKKLFEKFYRVQTEKTKDIQGTGLGLFIVKQIIEKMGGNISVISEEGKGSTFTFSLSLAGSYKGNSQNNEKRD